MCVICNLWAASRLYFRGACSLEMSGDFGFDFQGLLGCEYLRLRNDMDIGN
jgi:hypothetical protein